MSGFQTDRKEERVEFNPLLLELFECMGDDLCRCLISWLRRGGSSEIWAIAEYLGTGKDEARETLRQCIDYGMVTLAVDHFALTDKANILLDSLNDGINAIHYNINKEYLSGD